MVNINVFEDMPEAPEPPMLPKFFPDLFGKNQGRTPGAGWYQNDFLPWVQSQDKKTLFGFGIGMIILASIAAISGIGIYKYQDQVGEYYSQVSAPVFSFFHASKDKITALLVPVEESTSSAMDKIKKLIPMFGQNGPETGE